MVSYIHLFCIAAEDKARKIFGMAIAQCQKAPDLMKC